MKPPLSPYTWVPWAVEWEVPKALRGRSVTLQVRATDGRRQLQAGEVQSAFGDGASGYHTVRVKVR